MRIVNISNATISLTFHDASHVIVLAGNVSDDIFATKEFLESLTQGFAKEDIALVLDTAAEETLVSDTLEGAFNIYGSVEDAAIDNIQTVNPPLNYVVGGNVNTGGVYKGILVG